MTFTIHEPPNPPADRLDRADGLVFVKDGFSWLTAIFPPLGFLSQSLWLATGLYFAGIALLAGAFSALGVPSAWTSLAVTAVNVFLGFELSSLTRWTLDRNGWATLGAVSGTGLAECERRFLETWLPGQPAITATQRPGPSTQRRQTSMAWPFHARG